MISFVSGGFDPLHVGHIELIELAAAYGDVIVALNSDDWLIRKKHRVFMRYEERSRILRAINHVVAVIPVDDQDDTVCDALEKIKPDFFVNGGDRQTPNALEDNVCKRLNITQIFGGDKIQSSSNLVDRIK